MTVAGFGKAGRAACRHLVEQGTLRERALLEDVARLADYVIAGEASGDLYASRLVEQLKLRLPDAEFFGCNHGPRSFVTLAVW